MTGGTNETAAVCCPIFSFPFDVIWPALPLNNGVLLVTDEGLHAAPRGPFPSFLRSQRKSSKRTWATRAKIAAMLSLPCPRAH